MFSGFTEKYDVVVVGAGHAGCEAAISAARMGLKTALYTINLDLIAQMSCNPAVGGIAKGHLVREIDALGGVMGEVIDAVGIQFRLLNTSRGPAVWSPRAQADKKQYRAKMRQVLESEPNLRIKQAEVVDLVLVGEGSALPREPEGLRHPHVPDGNAGQRPAPRVRGIRLLDGRRVEAGAVVVTTGTFLNGLIHCGENKYPAGRSGEAPSVMLGEALRRLGFEIGRLKTGTPPRLDARTIDFSRFQVQAGDPIPTPFSFRTKAITQPQTVCWIGYTNAETHRIIRENVHRAPLYSGQIKGIGPRYCPSIEDKIVKFPDKPQHQLFLEPEGMDTNEIYVNGMSTSMPIDVQVAMVKSIPGLENAEMIRPGYAIEYDMVQPTELYPWLETKKLRNLFLAGQINGTTGYEEAGCQGIMAGINAGLRVQGKDPVMIERTQGYTGILIDDLVSKGVDEPYRMFTSRAEFRLHLRIDNADTRLTPYGRRVGLIGDGAWQDFLAKQARLECLRRLLENSRVDGQLPAGVLEKAGNVSGLSYAQLLRRPEISIDELTPALVKLYPQFFERNGSPSPALHARAAEDESPLPAQRTPPGVGKIQGVILSGSEGSAVSSRAQKAPSPGDAPLHFPPAVRNELKSIETEIKYAGYLQQQEKAIERLKKAEERRIPEWFDYTSVSGLSREMKELLTRVLPRTLGQASRIPGVTPAAVSLINVYIEIQDRRRAHQSGGLTKYIL